MFTQLIFIIVILLLTSFIRTTEDSTMVMISLAAYAALLGFIYLQARYLTSLQKRKEAFQLIISCELVAFLAITGIFIGLPQLPYFHSTFVVAYNFILYFGGLYLFFSQDKRQGFSGNAIKQVLVVIPFLIPLLIYTLINDSLLLAGINLEAQSFAIVALFGLCIAAILLLFMPPILLYFWQCKPLTDPLLLQCLQVVCDKAQFRHGGFKLWTVLNHAPTAAIIGILPKLRYVMFTRAIIHHLPEESLQAVLAHEIGHSKKHHLLKFPFILLGMGVAASLVLSVFEQGIHFVFIQLAAKHPFAYWQEVELICFFALTALTAAAYIRYVFGYFSRLFEKEADLYGMEIGLPASAMATALEGVAVATGNSHEKPSWHHDSIAKRIQCIKQAEANPALIKKHQRRVRRSLLIYSACLILGILFLSAPFYVEYQPFTLLNSIGLNIEKAIVEASFVFFYH